MAQVKQNDGATEPERSLGPKRERGLKQLRIWVSDPKAEGFREEALRQAARLKNAPEENDALDFIDAAFEWPRP